MQLSIKKKAIPKLTIGIIGMLFFIAEMLFGFQYDNLASLYTLFISVYLIWWSRNNSLMVIVFSILAYCNYCVTFSEYIIIKEGTMFTMYAGSKAAVTGAFIMLLFWSVFILTLPNQLPDFSFNGIKYFWIAEESNKWSVYAVLALNFIMLIIWIFGFRRPTEFWERGSPSTYYEYSLILFILCYYFGGEHKICRIVTILLSLMYVGQNFRYGGRITGIQVILIFYIMCLQEKVGLKKVIPFAFIGYIFLSIIGAYRGSWLNKEFSLSSFMNSLFSNMFVLDTSYSAYHTSLTFVLAKESQATLSVRLSIFFGFLKSIFFGKYGKPSNSVAHYTARYYHHYNGGFLPFFFYFFFGWLGVILIAVILSFYIKKLSKLSVQSNGLSKCLLVYFIVSTFRWYIYAPIQLTRGMLLMAFFYFVLVILINLVTNRTLGFKLKKNDT